MTMSIFIWVGLGLLLILILAMMALPGIIAFRRGHPDFWLILFTGVIGAFLGLIPWALAFGWALSDYRFKGTAYLNPFRYFEGPKDDPRWKQ